jgi:DNA adenine methylase
MKFIKSPIRYPGAKGRAIHQIAPLIPDGFTEYREPFLGGGSVFLYVRQTYPGRKYWINDLNYQLYNFWAMLQKDTDSVVEQISDWKDEYEHGKRLFRYLKHEIYRFDDVELASAYFVLKTIGFSGFTRGYSEDNFKKSFTEERIMRLKDIGMLLQGVRITNLDYEKLVIRDGENGKDKEDVFIFLDPPYYNVKWDELYGTRDRNLHAAFDHYRFAKVMKSCEHKWLITYDDSKTVRRLFDWANIIPWRLTYTSRKVKTGEELFISNYLEGKGIGGQKQANVVDAWM